MVTHGNDDFNRLSDQGSMSILANETGNRIPFSGRTSISVTIALSFITVMKLKDLI